MIYRGLSILLVFLFCATISQAQDNSAVARKESWIDVYLNNVKKLQDDEQKKGIVLPKKSTNNKLPFVCVSDYARLTSEIDFSVDVTGVDNLELSSARKLQIQNPTLTKKDGSTVKLSKDFLVKSGKRNAMIRNDFLVLGDKGTSLKLNGEYVKLSGKISPQSEQPIYLYIGTEKLIPKYGRSFNNRAGLYNEIQVSKRSSESIIPPHERPIHAGIMLSCLPNSFDELKVDPQKIANKYVKDLVPYYTARKVDLTDSDISQLQVYAAAVNSQADLNPLTEKCVLVTERARVIAEIAKKAGQVGRRPGMGELKLQLVSDEFKTKLRELDLYSKDCLANIYLQEKEADKLLDIIVNKERILKLFEATVAYVEKATPVSDADKQVFTALKKELEGSKRDALQYLATLQKIKTLRRKVLFSHPALDFEKILINRNPPTKLSHNSDQHLGRHARVGPGLTILSAWKTDAVKAEAILKDKLPAGSTRNPDLHYDAEKVIFAFSPEKPVGGESVNDRRFFIYEAAIDGSWVKQLTGTERDKFETRGNRATVIIEDNDPCYLPDDDIVFISTRSQTFGRCHGGRYSPAWVLYRCDPKGDNLKQLSYGNENEYEPSVLNDGRIVFTRWEYVNRHEMLFHMLWTTRPDGINVAHYYGNDTMHPMMVTEATAMPGSNKIVATAMGHHSFSTGTSVVIDVKKGENGEEPVEHITPETPYSETHGWPKPHYSHPYPINDEMFLVSRANHKVIGQGIVPPVNDRAIYLVDSLGGRELIYEDNDVASFSPIPIQKRKRPPVIPSMLPETASDEATLFVQNAYLTRNDPERIIKPGMIKAIRVNAIGVQPHAGRGDVSRIVNFEIPKKVLGTVPVDEDGSAFFKVPARTALQIQTLDENGMAIMTEKSFFYLQPGENRGCIGCHEPVVSAPSMSAISKIARRKPMELKPAAGPAYAGGLTFASTVQPVLDRYCISCHGLDKEEKKINLINDGGGWPKSATEILSRGDARVGVKWYMSGEDGEQRNISRPRDFFAYKNKVSHMLLENHGKVNMDKDSYMRIIEWLDLNAQIYGDLYHNKIEKRRIDSKALGELRAYIKELFGEKIANQPERALINVAIPQESRILQAPLAKDAGGWGQLTPAWKSKDDAGYKKMAELVAKCIVKNKKENTFGWYPPVEGEGGEDWVKTSRAKYLEAIKGTK